MKMKKCAKCKHYTLKDEHCATKTVDAHYKFKKWIAPVHPDG
jgi:rRNA maturation protein Nop10